ncbi:DNA (cytosine-5-)-methyltransferase [Glaciecola siphonariae]|uniref:Cytosine-specific methyltransferase n=1 Tax=Glaciecola siphonariae TaxID=521012 RepID=A0ABV9LZR8_9ALTE
MNKKTQTKNLLQCLLEIYDQKQIAEKLNPITDNDWCRETINRVLKGKSDKTFNDKEVFFLEGLFPKRPAHYDNPSFRFIDLFAGIGGIRKGFEKIGGKCVFTSEWNKFAVKTYKANHYLDPQEHVFNDDIRDVTLSNNDNISEGSVDQHIRNTIPDYDVLLAGFPCQPFSLAGVSKKNSLGRRHGFEDEAQGTLFFDVCRIIRATQPKAFLLENVKNLKSHDKGKTFKIILKALDELGYHVCDQDYQGTGSRDPRIIDGSKFLPQHRERIVLVGFRKDLGLSHRMSLSAIQFPEIKPTLADLLENLDTERENKYTLTPRLWEYLYEYSKKHKAKGNGFGYGLVNPEDPNALCRTLSARYHKDGSEILIDRGWDPQLGEDNFWDKSNQIRRPRRLTPRECARLMGFDSPDGNQFIIPVSDTQAYKQFGNSVVVPVFSAVAELMRPLIAEAIEMTDNEKQEIAAA